MHRRAGEYYAQIETDLLKAARLFFHAEAYEEAAQFATQDVMALINRGEARPLQTLLETFERGQVMSPSWLRLNLARGELYTFIREHQLAEASYQAVLAQLDQPNGSVTLSQADLLMLRARACRGMGDLLEQEAPKEALTWLQRGLETLAGIGSGVDATEKAIFHIKLSNIYIALANYAAALDAVQRGVALLPAEPGPWHISAYIDLGTIYYYQGDLQQGVKEWERGLAICQQQNQTFRRLSILINLGIAHYYAGNWDAAVQRYQEAVALAEHLGNVADQVGTANSLGSLHTNRGEYRLASEAFAGAIEQARRHKLHEELAYTLAGYSDLLLRQSQRSLATATLQEAETLANSLEIRHPLPEIYRGWVQVHLAKSEFQRAQQWAEKAMQIADALEAPIELGISLRLLGQIKHSQGQHAAALTDFARSYAILQQQAPYEAARTQQLWGECLEAAGDHDHGQQLLQEAAQTFLTYSHD
jgi:tetratricopeptide (TPR) repeat protein